MSSITDTDSTMMERHEKSQGSGKERNASIKKKFKKDEVKREKEIQEYYSKQKGVIIAPHF